MIVAITATLPADRRCNGVNRRAVLALAVGGAASLAGCNGFASSASDSVSDRPGAERTVTDGPDSGTETDPEAVLVRAGTDRQPIWLADPDSDDDGRPTPRPDQRHIGSVVVDSESRADRLSVAADVDGEAVQSFLAATDFDAETVFVETVRVEECFRLSLCRISWQPQKISTDYTTRSRSWDEACAVDEWVFEARLIRIPEAIRTGSRSARSTSIGTGACGRGETGPEAVGGGGSDPSTTADGDGGTARTNATSGGE
jgi:hypothetical protein